MRWDVKLGHDDVLVAAMLAIVARAQYPPPNILTYRSNVLERDKGQLGGPLRRLNPEMPMDAALGNDLKMIFRKQPVRCRTAIGPI